RRNGRALVRDSDPARHDRPAGGAAGAAGERWSCLPGRTTFRLWSPLARSRLRAGDHAEHHPTAGRTAEPRTGAGGMNAVLSARHLGFRYGKGATIFDDVSLDIGPREIVCLLGSSGCGKSTLLRAVAGLAAPT